MTAHDRVPTSAREGAGSTGEQAQGRRSGARKRFAEPRGWALKWDGVALSRLENRRNGHTPSPAG